MNSTHEIPAEMDIVSIALELGKKVQKIAESLQEQGRPLPSLTSNAPSPDFLSVGDVELQKLRAELVTSSRLLAAVFTGPRRYFMELIIISNANSMTLHTIYNFNIPSYVPLDGTITFADLAKAVGLDEDRLTRILRYAMLNYIFTEPTPGHVAHSVISRHLASGSVDMDFLGHLTEEIWPGSVAQVQALRMDTSEPTDCGIVLALGGPNKDPLFKILADQPERGKRFGNAMVSLNAPGGIGSVDNMLIAFDWRSLDQATVVDVGGSLGHTAISVLHFAENITKIIVQDLPEVIDQATSRPIPSGLEHRLEFQAASFFDPQPIKDADMYYFRYIFHDWPTERCIEILRNLVPSMKTGSRLLVNDFMLYPSDATDAFYSQVARAMDMVMMVIANAREQSIKEWEEMVESAVPGKLILESAKGLVVVFRKV